MKEFISVCVKKPKNSKLTFESSAILAAYSNLIQSGLRVYRIMNRWSFISKYYRLVAICLRNGNSIEFCDN